MNPNLQTTALPSSTHPDDAKVDAEVLRLIPKQFAITDEKTANWLVKRVIAARQYNQRVKEWAEGEHRRAAREEATLMYLFGRQIETWVKSEIKKLNGKRKSICLPGGTVGFRQQKSRLVIEDEATVINWARQHLPDAIQTVEKLVKTTINEHFEGSGELPDGAQVQPEHSRFYIT